MDEKTQVSLLRIPEQNTFRLAYGENFLYNFSDAFAKELLGVALALLPSLSQPIRGRMYRTKERLRTFG